MDGYQKWECSSANTPEDRAKLPELMREFFDGLFDGTKVLVTIEVLEDLTKMKKRYFAMISELAKHAGYASHKERELFKVQVRSHMNIDSVADIKHKQEMSAALEALHQFAAEHYHYTFSDGPATNFITFPGGQNGS